MTKWIAAEKARAGLRHAVVCSNVAESKRARAGSLAIVDEPHVARTCILRADVVFSFSTFVLFRFRFFASAFSEFSDQLLLQKRFIRKKVIRRRFCLTHNLRLHYTRLFHDPRFLLFVLQNISGYKNAVECLLHSMKWRYLGYLQLLSEGCSSYDRNGGQPTRGDG